MAQILVRNLEDQVKRRLQSQAKRHGRSMEEEAREILRAALVEKAEPAGGLGSEMVALFSGQGVYLDEPIQEWRGFGIEPIEFKE